MRQEGRRAVAPGTIAPDLPPFQRHHFQREILSVSKPKGGHRTASSFHEYVCSFTPKARRRG